MILLQAFRSLASPRLNRGATHFDLAQQCGVSQPTISKWLRGETDSANARDLEFAIQALGGVIEVGTRCADGGPLLPVV